MLVLALLPLVYSLLAVDQTETPTFTSNTSRVLVPVIVRNRHSESVDNLTKEDFQVFDNGKLQVLSNFTVQRAGLVTGIGLPHETSRTSQDHAIPQRFVIFLFDDLHLSAGELQQVRKAAVPILAESLQPTDAAAVISTSGQTNTGFTQSLKKLQDAIDGLRLQTLYAHVQGCPNLTYYQADLIINHNDPDALKEAIDDAKHCSPGAALTLGPPPHLGAVPAGSSGATMLVTSAAEVELAMGEQSTRISEGMIRQLIIKLGTLPGQHSLIFISHGFFVGTSDARNEEERILDSAAQANVMISSLDARGLYTFMLDTSERYNSLDKQSYNTAALKANDDVMSELAAGTGGTYFHNSNDLGGGFKTLTLPPECSYLLEFSPQNVKQDGTYHLLKVKVRLGGAKLQVRRGYFSDKVAKKKP